MALTQQTEQKKPKSEGTAFHKIFKKWLQRWILQPLLWAVALLVLMNMLIALPSVQTWIARKFVEKLFKDTHFSVNIDRLLINLPNQSITLYNLRIQDEHLIEMLALERLRIRFSLPYLLAGHLRLREARLENGHFSLHYDHHHEDLNINLFVETINQLIGTDTSSSSEPAPFRIDQVLLSNMAFSYYDIRQDSLDDGLFDPAHFSCQHIYGKVLNLFVHADTVRLRTRQLQLYEPQSELAIKRLDVDFHMDAQHMFFDNLALYINDSYLGKQVRMSYEHIGQMSSFVDSVTLDIWLENSRIATTDLERFSGKITDWKDSWQLNGHLQGSISDLIWQDASLRFGLNSYLQGNLAISGLPHIQDATLEADFPVVALYADDLAPYLPESVQPWAQRVGFIEGELYASGYAKDFLFSTQLYTAIGSLSTQISYYQDETSTSHTQYELHAEMEQFHLGKLLGNELVGSIDANLSIEGSGLETNNINSKLKLHIDALQLNHYTYQQISLQAGMQQGWFQALLSSNDPASQFILQSEGKWLPDSLYFAQIEGNISHVDLERTHWVDTTAHIQALFKGSYLAYPQLQNQKLDLALQPLEFLYGAQKLHLQNTYIEYHDSSLEQNLRLQTDLFDLNLNGHYTPNQLVETTQELINDILSSFKQEEQQPHKTSIDHTQLEIYAQLWLHIHDLNPLMRLFLPQFYLSEELQFEGLLQASIDSIYLKLNSRYAIDSLSWQQERLYESNLHIEMFKPRLSNDVLAQFDFSSERQQWMNIPTEALRLQFTWYKNAIDFQQYIRLHNDTSLTDLHLQGSLELGDKEHMLYFYNSYFTVSDMRWQVAPHRPIYIGLDSTSSLRFEQFYLAHRGESIILNGSIARASVPHQLDVELNTIDLTQFADLFGAHIGGTLVGGFSLRNLYESVPIIEGEAEIEDLVFDGVYIGYLSSIIGWDAARQSLIFNLDLYDRTDYVFFLQGYYQYASDQLQALAEMKETELRILSPFLGEYLSELSGTVSGKLSISGQWQRPYLRGILDFNNARFRVNYLGTRYQFSSRLYITPDRIQMNNLRLTDNRQGSATLNGSIQHRYFQDIYLDLNLSLNRFRVLNTTPRQGEPYYGDATVSGNAQITGSPDNLYLKANARTEAGTKLFIPLYGAEKVVQKEYIVFKSFNQSDSLSKRVREVRLQTFRMNFNLDITPDAYFEIIFDPRAGDIMRGNGQGKIQINIDSRGEFSLWGDYYIHEGSYNFTMLNVVNKQFRVRRGSTIYFMGDIYSAELDIKAFYEAISPLSPLVNSNSTAINAVEYNRRYPLQVLLHLTGPMLAPDIHFDIDFTEAERSITDPTLRSAIYNFKARIAGDEQERNRQVFSLILFKRLSAENSFSGVAGAGGNTVSELLSNQLSHWMSQVDDNLQIDVDLTGFDRQTNNVFHVRLSYTLMDGRLRVTRDGLIDTQNQSTTANVVGEWTVEYMITPDGRYRLKMYNKNLTNGLPNSFATNTNTAAGFSLMYTRSFNSLRDLFCPRSRSRTKKQKKDSDKPTTPSAPSQPEL